MRNPPGDAGLRQAERGVAAGDPAAVPALIAARVRSGAVTPEQLRWAEYFSRPFVGPQANVPRPGFVGSPAAICVRPPGSAAARVVLEDWSPVSDWIGLAADAATAHHDNELTRGSQLALATFRRHGYRFAQHAGTPLINQAILAVWPKRLRKVGSTIRGWQAENASQLWAVRHGFTIGSWEEYNHPPYEVDQYDDPESSMAPRLVTIFNNTVNDLLTRYSKSGEADPRITSVSDAARWEVRRLAFEGDEGALKLLGFLRARSTLEYMDVLAPMTTTPLWFAFDEYDSNQEPPPALFGDREFDLVRTLLGGPPL